MMKRIRIIVLLLLSVILLCACTDKPAVTTEAPTTTEAPVTTEPQSDEWSQSAKEAHKSVLLNMEPSDAMLGVAYLGYFDGTFEDALSYLEDLGVNKQFLFAMELKEDAFVDLAGGELYLLVPAYGVTLSVCEAVLDEESFILEKGDAYYIATDGMPVLLSCNESEIISNVIITADDFNGSAFTYSPQISGADGSLITTEGVLDITPYDELAIYYGFADGADPIYCGEWFCEAADGDGNLKAMMLSLYPDGSAEYLYGIGNSEVEEIFGGDWYYDSDRDMILLDMVGGPPPQYDGVEFSDTEVYELKCGFKWDMDYRDDGTYLCLTHEEGNSILFGKNGAAFEFIQMPDAKEDVAEDLIGTWAIISEKSEVYLELFVDGKARFTATRDETVEKDIFGTWSAEGLTLYLDFAEDGERFGGEYGISFDGELLTLSILGNSDSFTEFMKENGYEQFMFNGVG